MKNIGSKSSRLKFFNGAKYINYSYTTEKRVNKKDYENYEGL